MKYGICPLSIIPQRAAPKDEAEMVNQILFGDIFTVIESQSQWRKVSLASDGYAGWIDEKQMTELSFHEFEELKNAEQFILQDNFGIAEILSSKKQIQVYRGSSFYFNQNKQPLFATSINELFQPKKSAKALISFAEEFLTTPYLWGGRSILGIDCSGFTQIVLKLSGYQLSRDTPEQETQGKPITFINQASGDLAFFTNKNGRVIHVGIILENKKIIHASGEVRIDSFTKEGIYNSKRNLLTHQLHSIKRMY